MVERDLALAAYERQPIHLLHLSARESVDELRRWQAEGVAATGEATPHHLVLTDEAVRSLDANLKMNPPLRSADDRRALVDAVRDGTISVIATDHAPHALHEKDVPFEEAPFGVTGLETAFASLNTHLVGPGLLTLPTLIERMSAGPARAYGLEPPRIAKGAKANLVLFDPDAVWRVGDGGFRSRSTNSWLLGETVKGKVRLTVANGRVAFSA
jgi:dihydroorotase